MALPSPPRVFGLLRSTWRVAFLWVICAIAPFACTRHAWSATADGQLLLGLHRQKMQISLLSSLSREPLITLDLPRALSRDIVVAPDGSYFLTIFDKGDITRYELPTLQRTAVANLGSEVGALAISGDARWIAVATHTPPRLSLLDSALQVSRQYDSTDLQQKQASKIGSIWTNTQRMSFVVEQTAIAELWEVSYAPNAEPIHEGLVHDYRMHEAIARQGFLGIRRVPLESPLRVLALDATGRHVFLGTHAPGDSTRSQATSVVNLDIRRKIIPLPGIPPVTAAALGSTNTGDPAKGMVEHWSAQGIESLYAVPPASDAHLTGQLPSGTLRH